MQLHCLGSGGYFPNDHRHTSCYYVPDWAIVLDAGTGLFRLGKFALPDRIDILLSHVHLDHVFGLTTLLVICHQHPDTEVHLWGEPDKLSAIDAHLLSESLFPVPLPVVRHPIQPGQTFGLPHVNVIARRQDHPGGSLAFAIDDSQRRLVYATDTTGDASESFAQFAGSPDLLVHECYFKREQSDLAKQTGHTDASRLAEVIGAVKPRQTLITHVNPLGEQSDPIDVDWIASVTGGKLRLATDQLQIEF